MEQLWPELMEGDNPESMFAFLWNEKCSTTTSNYCALELTHARKVASLF